MCGVVRDDYLLEAERQLKIEKTYGPVTFNDKMIKSLRRGGHLSGKQLCYYNLKVQKGM